MAKQTQAVLNEPVPVVPTEQPSDVATSTPIEGAGPAPAIPAVEAHPGSPDDLRGGGA